MYNISNGERAVVLMLINKIDGVNRTDGRLVVKVQEHLRTEEVIQVPIAELDDTEDYELTELEVEWLIDHIDKSFNKQEMPPSFARFALSLEEKLKDAEEVD